MSFHIRLLRKRRSNQMAAVMLQVIPSFFAEYSEKCLFFSTNTYKIYIVWNNYCVAFHNDKTCSVSNCKFHNILLGNVEELLKKLDTFCFTYQHVDCLYALFQYRFNGKLLQREDKCLITFDEHLTLIIETRVRSECRAMQKRGFCGKVQKAVIQLLSEDKNNAD